MGAVRNLNIALSEELAAKLDDAVVSGGYDDIGELLGDLLHDWQYALSDTPENIARLRRAWEEGIVSGPAVEGNFDLEDIKKRGEARLAAMRAAR